VVKKKSNVPEGVLILAVLVFAGAVVSFLLASFMFSFADGIRSMDPSVLISAGFDGLGYGLVILLGLFFLGMSIFNYFVGQSLLIGRNWARIILGVFSALGIIVAVMNLFNGIYASGVFSLIVNGVIVWYLFTRKETKKFFK